MATSSRAQRTNSYIGAGIISPGAGGGVVPPVGFALLRTVPGTLMMNPNNLFTIAPAIAGQGVSA